ncbi:hypothetical protein ACLOJK_036911 [Asimina triloba]
MDAYNYQWGYESIYEEDVMSAASAQLAAWQERLEINAQVGYEEDALSAAAAQLAAWKEHANGSDDQCVGSAQQTSETFSSNTESNLRHDDRAQYPSVTVSSEVQPKPQTQNAEELESSSCSSPNPSPALPTNQSPCKQPSFNEEKAPQVELPTFSPIIRYVPPELNSSYK